MHLIYYATLPVIRRVTEEDRTSFHRMTWDPFELIELRQMRYTDLMGLMVFCDIRVFNDMPIIACTEDEMRLAYIAWRSVLSKACRVAITRKAERATGLFQKIMQGIQWWTGEMT
jgi:hypothetical protein